MALYEKKTWVDRVTEHPSRRTMTDTTTNTTTTVDVARAEGTVSKEGDALNAENLNAWETRILAAFTKVTEAFSLSGTTLTINLDKLGGSNG